MKKTLYAVIAVTLLGLSACGAPAAPQLPDDPNVATYCVNISASQPGNIQTGGQAVLQDAGDTSNFYLLDLATGAVTPLAMAGETIGQTAVSPDHKSLALQIGTIKTNAWSLVIADGQATRKESLPWKQGFFGLGNWINNTQLLVATYPPLLVINPYTGEQKGYQYTDFPNYLADNTSNRVAFFDPGMKMVLYKSQDDRDTLLDLASQRVLAQVDNHPDPAPIAAWSPDGSRVAVVGTVVPRGKLTPGADIGHDIFSLSADGRTTQLTHLTAHYGPLLTIAPNGISWSPDSRYLAFWFIYPGSASMNWELAVYDMQSRQTTNYCIQHTTASVQPLGAPVWAPNGRQLMVENRSDAQTSHLVILDLDQKAAFQVKDNVYPSGWLVSATP